MDKAQIAQFVQGLITEIGEDPGREGLRETPQRVAKSFEKLFEGYGKDPKDLVTVFDNEGYSEMVVARDIDFYSLCEHHMLPFYGKVYVGYVPENKIIGLSKIPRLVEMYSRRLQNQERLTKQVAETLNEILHPKGVGIVIDAEHMCIKLRGVEKQNCKISTSTFIGLFLNDPRTRSEFLRLIAHKS